MSAKQQRNVRLLQGKEEPHSIPGWIGTAAEMARMAGVSKRTVTRWIADGTLKVRKLGPRKIVCRPQDIDKAIAIVADRYEMEAGQ